MLNRGTYNSTQYNSVPLVATEEEEIIPPIAQVGGNFKTTKKRRRLKRNEYPFLFEIPLIAEKAVLFKYIFKAVGNKAYSDQRSLVFSGSKLVEVKSAYLVKASKQVKFTYSKSVVGIYCIDLNDFFVAQALKGLEISETLPLIREYLVPNQVNLDVNASKEVPNTEVYNFVSIGDKLNIFTNNIKTKASKEVILNNKYSARGKKDFTELLSLGLMDI